MQETRVLSIISKRKKTVLNINSILYVILVGKSTEIHVAGGRIYETRMSLSEIEELLSDDFIKIHRGCIVSVMAIHDITDHVILSNGESLIYTIRKKKDIIKEFREKQKNLIKGFVGNDAPVTESEYHQYYRSFDNMPFAFTDIEMIFNDEKHAVDWIFRYGNDALAKLEKVPLEQLIGSSFGSLFANMDSKWLRSYERAALYGETLEIIDYSPEIDTDLKVICFPTFKGHCGCILFDISDIKFAGKNSDIRKTLMFYFADES